MTVRAARIVVGAALVVGGLAACVPAPPPPDRDTSPPLTAVPAVCPDPARIQASVSTELNAVFTSSTARTLECTYYAAGSPGTEQRPDGTKGLAIRFSASHGLGPDAFRTKILSTTPRAEVVPGVADAAVYSTGTLSNTPVGTLDFLSGAVVGHAYGEIGFATKRQLTALIDDGILAPK